MPRAASVGGAPFRVDTNHFLKSGWTVIGPIPGAMNVNPFCGDQSPRNSKPRQGRGCIPAKPGNLCDVTIHNSLKSAS